MEIIENNVKPIKIRCLSCGSILAAFPYEFRTEIIDSGFAIPKFQGPTIDECPCCKRVNQEVEVLDVYKGKIG